MYDVIVVGAGIAGLTAALYSKRLGLNILVISRDIGGQAILAPEIQNYPGFISINGLELVKKLQEHVMNYDVEIVFDEVIEVREKQRSFTVRTASGAEYRTLTLILAIGKAPRELNVPGEKEFKGRGVSYCTICDAPLFRGKRVALIGVGEAGLHGALILSEVVKECYWIFPTPNPGTSDKERLNYLKSKDNVKFMPNTKVIKIEGDTRVRAIVVKNLKDNKEETIRVDGIFVEMGYVTKTEFLKGFIELNEKGEIVIDKLCRTSKEGVFAAGDVTDIPYKQAVISAGQGATAALSAYNYIARIKGLAKVISDWKHIKVKTKEPKEGFFLRI